MMDAVRVVLIDPLDESRETLQRLLGGLNAVWLAEVCKSYAGGEKAVAEQGPDIALVNLDADPAAGLACVAALARRHAAAAILPASADPAGDLILRTMRAGAREFLALPANPAELLDAIGNLVQAPAAGASARLGGRVIAFAGAAGGVGCTTLAVNVAAALASDPRRSVALADFDLFTGAVDACLDIVPNYTLLEVAQNAERLDLTLLKRSMARHACGVHVLPRPANLEDAARVDPAAMNRVITLLKAAFSIVVIDASKALHGSDFVAFEMADVLVLAVQLELACLRNSARLVQLLRQSEALEGKLRLAINRTGLKECQITTRKAQDLLGMAAAWSIPDAPREFAICRSKGMPLQTEFARSRVGKSIDEMAKQLSEPRPATEALAAAPMRRIAAMF